MIDHISLAVSDLKVSSAFYDAVLQTLGLSRIVTREATSGWGKKYPEFWVNARPGLPPVTSDTGVHIALRARSQDAVDSFHACAIANGGVCDGPPGPRQAEMTVYYGAFIRDPDGNKIEVLTFPSTSAGS